MRQEVKVFQEKEGVGGDRGGGEEEKEDGEEQQEVLIDRRGCNFMPPLSALLLSFAVQRGDYTRLQVIMFARSLSLPT